ncbi:uncharacterized protein LOC111024352 [Momordica charantia]|uniref:Uncharacterized protein LOC111024352 n=1 Tax=Momordica charantia TaxID=3673 RepID=A0A6J1DXA5_MOMCH|nr:uncharacterized protein LOC111024352 [Momordica charantia]
MPEQTHLLEVFSLEQTMIDFMARTDESIRRLQIQVELMVDELRNSPSEALPTNMEEQGEAFNERSELEDDELELPIDNDDPPIPEVINEVWKNKEVEPEKPIEVMEHELTMDLNPSPLNIGPLFPFPRCSLEITQYIQKEELTKPVEDQVNGELGEDVIGSDEGFYVKVSSQIPIFKNQCIQVSHLPLELDLKAYCALKERNFDMVVAEERSNVLEEMNES